MKQLPPLLGQQCWELPFARSLTATSMTGDPSPFHNFQSKFNLSFNVFLSKTIQKTYYFLYFNLIQGIYHIYHDFKMTKTVYDWSSPHKIGDFSGISLTEQSCPSLISKRRIYRHDIPIRSLPRSLRRYLNTYSYQWAVNTSSVTHVTWSL